MNFPTGPIKTSGRANVSWDVLFPFQGAIIATAQQSGCPASRICGHIIIESNGNPAAHQVNPANGDSYGLMQVVPRYWKTLVEKLSGKTYRNETQCGRDLMNNPTLGIQAGVGVLKSYFDQYGDWDKASSAFFTGKPNWVGSDSVNGTTAAQYRDMLHGLMAEVDAANTANPPVNPPANSDGDKVAQEAQKHVGQAYVPAGSGPNAFDCSGLVAYCVKTALGIDISHDSHAQFALGTDVSQSVWQPGDMLFYDTQSGNEVRNNNRASHVGIYIGNNQMVNALNVNDGIKVSDPFSTYFKPLFLGARREIWKTGVQPPVPDNPLPDPTFPFAPWPSGFTIHIATKRANSSGSGWNRVQPKRGDRLTHIVVHHTAGGPGFTKDSCHDLFSIGGQREYEALTEAVMDRDGTGYLLNDPWSDDPMDGSGRSPWASGPANAMDDVGVAYVNKYGADAVNDRGFAMEHCNAAGERWQDAMIAEGAKVYAVVLTRRKISYQDFPLNAPNGMWIGFHHDDFASTECPGISSGVWQGYIDAIRTEMKALQVGGVSPPGPPPEPPPVIPPEEQRFTHLGLTLQQVSDYFGVMKRVEADGSITPLPFNPVGALSTLWINRCDKESIFPAANELNIYDSKVADGKEMWASWVNGWLAYLPLDNQRAGWTWADAAAPKGVFIR